MGIECDPFPDATTRCQRRWTYARDDFRCQMPLVSIQGPNLLTNICGEYGEDVHHIWPKRAMVFEIKQNPHTPYNLVLLCRYHHMLIHPDIIDALRERVFGDKNALEELFARRIRLLKNGLPYWNTAWDKNLRLIAKRRTEDFLNDFPKTRFPFYHLSVYYGRSV